MYRQVLSVDYAFGKTYAKGIRVNVSVADEIKPMVTFYKLGGQEISLTNYEFTKLTDIEPVLTSFFGNSGEVDGGSRMAITPTLGVRFDTSFESRMLVLERHEAKHREPGARTSSIWLIERSWTNFLSLLPLIRHHLAPRIHWIESIENLIEQMAKDTLLMYRDQLLEGVTTFEYKKLLSTLDPKSYNSNLADGLDVMVLFHELCCACAEHVLYVARKNM